MITAIIVILLISVIIAKAGPAGFADELGSPMVSRHRTLIHSKRINHILRKCEYFHKNENLKRVVFIEVTDSERFPFKYVYSEDFTEDRKLIASDGNKERYEELLALQDISDWRDELKKNKGK